MQTLVNEYNWQAFPVGGWHFVVGGGITVRSSTLKGLIDEVKTYRANRGIDPSSSERDVHDYLCSKNPANCKGKLARQLDGGKLEPRIVKYTTDMLLKQRGGMLELAGKDEAEARAKVCLGCEHNRAYNAGCNSCGTNVQAKLAGVRQTKEVKGGSLLGGCVLLGCDNKTEIWFNKGSLPKPENYVSCWKYGLKKDEVLGQG